MRQSTRSRGYVTFSSKQATSVLACPGLRALAGLVADVAWCACPSDVKGLIASGH